MFFVFIFVGLALFYAFLVDNLLENTQEQDKQTTFVELEKSLYEAKATGRIKQVPEILEAGLHTFIGKEANEVIETYGEPYRVDLSAYDYEWWIYYYQDSYLQIGIEDSRVVTIYFNGDDTLAKPFFIGQYYDEINEAFQFQSQVSFNVENNSYQFNLNEEELLTRPLLQSGSVFIQLYFDTITNQLSGVRYLDGKTLIKQRPYSVIYRGELLEPNTLTRKEWQQIEQGLAWQILDITNVIRKRHNLEMLEWDDDTSVVALGHSEDMKINDYFSHTSPTAGELKDRLKKQGILFQLAGENIAAKYVDAIAVVEGWLNSEGHRVNLLHEDFTHLGVGVYERYYTQNFITPW